MYQKCLIIIIFIPIIHAFACGQSTIKPNVLSSTRIINGTEADRHSWPWIVRIHHPIIGHLCGGSIIDANYIISAAHCFFHDFLDTSIVYIGSHYLSDKNESRTIKEVIRHPDYILTDGNPNDIVILKLNESINITAHPPICLPTSDTVTLELPGQNATVAGWGLTSEGVSSEVLLQTTLTIYDPSIPECQPFINDTNKQLCVGVIDGGTGSCSGDSGGPLMAEYDKRYYLVGIVSAGIAGCGNTSSLYIRIRAFMDWICETDSKIAFCSTSDTNSSSSSLTSSSTSTSMISLPDTRSNTTQPDDDNCKTIIIATVVPAGLVIVVLIAFCVWKNK